MSQAEVLADLQSKIGSEIHVSDWHVVDQAQINNFADATGDHQWIHVDPERAAKESLTVPPSRTATLRCRSIPC